MDFLKNLFTGGMKGWIDSGAELVDHFVHTERRKPK